MPRTRSKSLCVRHYRKTQGHPRHDRRLPRRKVRDREIDLRPQEEDVFECSADIGRVTGRSYVVNGATRLIYEGALDTPARDRF